MEVQCYECVCICVRVFCSALQVLPPCAHADRLHYLHSIMMACIGAVPGIAPTDVGVDHYLMHGWCAAFANIIVIVTMDDMGRLTYRRWLIQ